MTTSAQTLPRSPFAVFRNRSFTLLWIGEFVSTAGSALTELAAAILVYRLTGSALSVALMLLATTIPNLVLGLLAGVFADRWDRKRMMIGADLLRAGLVCLMPLLTSFGIAWLYVAVVLADVAGQFFEPAHDSLLPEVAAEEELAAANSLMRVSSFGSTAVGYAASGLIAASMPIELAFYLDAVSFVVSALCVALVRVTPNSSDERATPGALWNNLLAGGRFLFASAPLRSLYIAVVPVLLGLGLTNALLLPFSQRALHATTFEYGLQEGLTSAGFVAASLLLARFADRLREGQWLVLSFAGMALAGIAYALSSNVTLAIAILIVSGFFNAPLSVALHLLIQRNTSRDVRGRVYSAFFVLRSLVSTLGIAAAGLADFIDVRLLYLGGSLILLAAAGLVLLLPGLRQPAAEWRQAIARLRGAPGPAAGRDWRPAGRAELDRLRELLPPWVGDGVPQWLGQARVAELAAGTVLLRQGERSDAAYFILSGQLLALRQADGAANPLEVLNAGDFCGEIAALTGAPRSADVLVDRPSTLLQIPAATLRRMMDEPRLQRLLLSKMTERLVRLDMVNLPRYAALEPDAVRELYRPEPASAG